MATDTPVNFTILVSMWILFSVCATTGLVLIRNGKTKLSLYRLIALATGLLGLWTVCQLPGTTRDLVTAGITLALIVALNIGLVRVCDRCAAIAYPRSFTRAAYCSKCGAAIVSCVTLAIGVAITLPVEAQNAAAHASCRKLALYGMTFKAKDVLSEYAEFIPFIPPGQKLIDLRCGSIKGDGTETFFLVTRPDIDIGTLTLLSWQRNGTLNVEASNKTVIQSTMAGSGGGYQGIDIKRSKFTINNSSGGTAGGASVAFTFKFSKSAKSWILDAVKEKDYDADGRQTNPLNVAPRERIRFTEFDGKMHGIVDPRQF